MRTPDLRRYPSGAAPPVTEWKIYIGTKQVQQVFIGSKEVKQIYLGAKPLKR